jgi:hypothetical protein
MSVSRRSFLTNSLVLTTLSAVQPVSSLAARSSVFASQAELVTLETLTHENAQSFVGTNFQVSSGQKKTILKLIAVTDLRTNAEMAGANRHHFSLRFSGTRKEQLPQGTYTFQHITLGTFPLFIVPAGRAAATATYTAIINRI